MRPSNSPASWKEQRRWRALSPAWLLVRRSDA
jgi:hypothetical protein